MTRPAPTVTVPEAIAALKYCVENEKAHWSMSDSCDPCVDVPVEYLRVAVVQLAAAPAAPQAAGVGETHPCYDEHQPGCDCVIPAQTVGPVPSYLERLSAPSREPEGGAVMRQALERIGNREMRRELSAGDYGVDRTRCPSCGHAWDDGKPEHHADECAMMIARAALATREEAPAEAGDAFLLWLEQEIDEASLDIGASHQEGGTATEREKARLGILSDVRAEYLSLRAQSQAREDAQPVAWREVFIVDEEDGPVSGICIDMADGSQIWTGECSNALLDGMGDEQPDESGQFVMVAMKGKPTRVVASVSNVDDGIEIARSLASRTTHPAPDALRVAVDGIEAARRQINDGQAEAAHYNLGTLLDALQSEQKGGA